MKLLEIFNKVMKMEPIVFFILSSFEYLYACVDCPCMRV